MKALVVHGAGDLRFDDLVEPAPDEGQVLVRNTHGGICGSDLHYYRHGAVGAFELREPLVLGHEVVGRIAEDPAGALAVGTPIAIHPATPCDQCRECATGVRNICRNTRYFGCRSQHAAHSGRVIASSRPSVKPVRVLPETLPLSRAVLAEPLAVDCTRSTGPAASPAPSCSSAVPARSASSPPARKAAGAAEGLDHGPAGPPPADRARRRRRPHRPDRRRGAAGPVFDVAIEASGASVAVGATLAAVRRRGGWALVEPPARPPTRGAVRTDRRRSTTAGRSGSTPSSTTRSRCSPGPMPWTR